MWRTIAMPITWIGNVLTAICFGAEVVHTTMQFPFMRCRSRRWRDGWWRRVPKWGWWKEVVEVAQHLVTVPGPAHSGGLAVTRVHTQRRLLATGGEVTIGHAKAQRRAEVEQATPGHPLPALVDFLTGGWQDEGVIPHPQTTSTALMEESEVIRVQRRCVHTENKGIIQ